MVKDKILVIGASGQIGVELTLALRKIYGNDNVIASDLREEHPLLKDTGPFLSIDIMNKQIFHFLVKRYGVTQVYMLAAILSATGEKNPSLAWNINMQSLLNVLDVAREEKLDKIYWPSSIAVFGESSPRKNAPQHTILEPATVYGISKFAGERWCEYYHKRYGVDVRSLRYPGLISYKSSPGGGTTDYAVEIFHEALQHQQYSCFLKEDTYLPMMYMPDAIRATVELMDAPAEKISVRSAYNISAMSFSPKELAQEIKNHIPGFKMSYAPDYRQDIAKAWPQSVDDADARKDWGWQQRYDMPKMVKDMLENVEE